MIVTFATCHNSIRTIPALQHDSARPEDVDTASEDHAGDDWRYAAMSRPWTPPSKVWQSRATGGRGRSRSGWIGRRFNFSAQRQNESSLNKAQWRKLPLICPISIFSRKRG